MSSLIQDDSGAMEIPLRLVIYVIITAAIVVLVIFGLSQVYPGMTANTMEKQLGDIAVSLNTMQNGGARNLIDPASPTGNIRTFKINIPVDIEYISFGADPDPDNDGNQTNTAPGLLTERGNVIFYKSERGGKTRIPLDETIEIREGVLEDGVWVVNNKGGNQYGVVLQGKGRSEITFELVYDPISKQRYTLAHFTDKVNAIINPYDPAVLPNSIWVAVQPAYIPADGVTLAYVIVQLKDKKGRDAAKEGVEVNLSTSLGVLTSSNMTTDAKGRASIGINSSVIGVALITANATGLNPGSSYLVVKQVPVVLSFSNWINSSGDMLGANFTSNQTLRYSISLIARGTEFWGWPNASIEIDGTKIGEMTVDSAFPLTLDYPQVTLPGGTHTLNVTLANDFWIPVVGDRNLYVERVRLSE
jgi:hypothetical protein